MRLSKPVFSLVLAGLLLTAGSSPAAEFTWRLNEGTGNIFKDKSGRLAGQAQNCTWTAGFTGKALYFDGKKSRAEVGLPAETLNNYTISCWINPHRQHNGTILEIPGEIAIRLKIVSGYWTRIETDVKGIVFSAGTIVTDLDAWTHVAVTYDGNAVRLFLNGVSMAESKAADKFIKTTTLFLGADKNGTSFFNGDIDELAVDDRAWDFTGFLERNFAGRRTGKQSQTFPGNAYRVWVTGPTEMVSRDAAPERSGTLSIALAGNEHEGAQMVIAPQRDLRNIRIQVSQPAADTGAVFPLSNIALYRVAYVYNPPELFGTGCRRVLDGFYPDPLPPLPEYFDATKEEGNQPVFISIYAPDGTAPGVYRGKITISPANAAPVVLPLEITVRGFSLPEKPRLRGEFNILYGRYWQFLDKFYGLKWGSEELKKMYEKYYYLLLEHRLNPKEIPVDLFSPEAPRYLSDPRLSSYSVFDYTGGLKWVKPRGKFPPEESIDYEDRAQMERAVALLKKGGWWDKCYFIGPIDEPGPSFAPYVKRVRELYKNIDPTAKFCLTGAMHPEFEGLADIWMVHPLTFNPVKASAFQAKGTEIFLYLADTYGYGCPNYFLGYARAETRVMGWLYRLYDIQGYEYFSVDLWYKNPWQKPAPTNNEDDNFQGVLIYPGPDGPVSSLRLEAIRDGMEDYEYLCLLEDRLKSAREKLNIPELDPAALVKEYCKAVAPALNRIPHQPGAMYGMRRRIAEEITMLDDGIWLAVPPGKLALSSDERELLIAGRTFPGRRIKVDRTACTADTEGRFTCRWKIPMDIEPVLNVNGHPLTFLRAGAMPRFDFTLDPGGLINDSDEVELYSYAIPDIPLLGSGKPGTTTIEFRADAPRTLRTGKVAFSSLQAVRDGRYVNLWIENGGKWRLLYDGRRGRNDSRLYDVSIPSRDITPWVRGKRTLRFKAEFVNESGTGIFTGIGPHSAEPFFSGDFL